MRDYSLYKNFAAKKLIKIRVLYYWIFKNNYNIKLPEIYRYLKMPPPKKRALYVIKNIAAAENFFEISFKDIDGKLYWPRQYDLEDLYTICAETFYPDNWHYYEYEKTKVDSDDVVVDAGASEGLFSLSVINRCKKSYIVEPNVKFYSALKKTFNEYIPEKAELFNVALGDRESQMRLADDSITSMAIDQGGEEIDVVTLDKLVTGRGEITYIKADLEGYEMKMLKGAADTISRFKPKMAITAYHLSNDYIEMIKFIKGITPSYKYKIKGITQYRGNPVMVHFWV